MPVNEFGKQELNFDKLKEEIRKRAYDIYLRKGGDADTNWLLAEEEVLREHNLSQWDKSGTSKYVNKLTDQLREWDSKIKELQSKAHTMKDDRKEKYQSLLNNLEKERDLFKVKLNELKSSGGASITELKKGSERIWDDMKKTYENIALKFR
jgi:predicted transcriptional regulator